MAKEIVICTNGWVFAGECYEYGDHILIHRSSVIRRWGTSKGIGQLAITGPTEDTILDECGTMTVYKANIISRILIKGSWI